MLMVTSLTALHGKNEQQEIRMDVSQETAGKTNLITLGALDFESGVTL